MEVGINKPAFRNQPVIILWFCIDVIFSVIHASHCLCSFSLFPSENSATAPEKGSITTCTSFLQLYSYLYPGRAFGAFKNLFRSLSTYVRQSKSRLHLPRTVPVPTDDMSIDVKLNQRPFLFRALLPIPAGSWNMTLPACTETVTR